MFFTATAWNTGRRIRAAARAADRNRRWSLMGFHAWNPGPVPAGRCRTGQRPGDAAWSGEPTTTRPAILAERAHPREMARYDCAPRRALIHLNLLGIPDRRAAAL
jgi:hypothetical protein